MFRHWLPQWRPRVIAVACGLLLLAVGGLADGGLAGRAAAAASPRGGQQLTVVRYRGYRFEVPASWPVITDDSDSTTCVRFDVHAVYLGVPPANQDCPSWLVGTTEALLIQPGPDSARTASVEDPVANQITATAPGIAVTATFDTDPTVIYRILASAGLAAPVMEVANPGGVQDTLSASQGGASPDIIFGAVSPQLPATVGNEVGLGFDDCAAPSERYMSAWWQSSPYAAIGIYIGGADRACDQVNLTRQWVRREAATGWRFVPMYVGPQASFGQLSAPARQGKAAAADAVLQAEGLSFGPRTPIYYDMEAYPPSDAGAAIAFLSAWTRELHALGYESGVYSSSGSAIADLARDYRSRRVAMPDVVYDALWNGSANVADPVYGPGEWTDHRRLHQFSGNVLQTYGGDTMDIDQDYLDLALTAPGGTTQFAPGATEADSSSSVFYEGSDHQLWEESRTRSGAWSRTDLGGQLSSPPSVVQVGKYGLDVLYRSRSGELTVVRRAGGRWLAAQELPAMGVIGGAPRAIAQTNGVIDVFWSGHFDKHLWHGEYNPGQGWSGPQPLQGSLAGWPYPVESGNGAVQVFWEGTDGRLWRVVRKVGANWTAPQDLGMGPMGGPPLAVQLPDGETDVFWRGKVPHSVWSAIITPGQRVIGPRNLGGTTAGAPWPVVAAGVEAVFFRGVRGRLWELTRVGDGNWSDPAEVGRIGRLSAAPFAATGGSLAPLQLFWTGRHSRLWSARFTAKGGWQRPVDLGVQVRSQTQ